MENLLARLNAIDAKRKAIVGERYATKETLAKSVQVDSFDQFGRAVVLIDGTPRAIGLHRGATAGLPAYDLVLQVAEKPFNYADNAKNIVTVPAGMERVVLINPAA